jgi:hypothetical protein
MTKNEIWAAGFLSAVGSFFTRKDQGRAAVSLTIKSRIHPQAVQRFAEIAEVNAIDSPSGMKVSITGNKLHDLMHRLWDELPQERKLEYAVLRKEVKAYANA